MIYAYKCPECQQQYESILRGDRLYTECMVCEYGGPLKRKYILGVERPMQEHWNGTVQAPISDMNQFKRELKKQGDQYEDLTGMPVNYQPVDMMDFGKEHITEEGLDATNRQRVAQGQKPIRIP